MYVCLGCNKVLCENCELEKIHSKKHSMLIIRETKHTPSKSQIYKLCKKLNLEEEEEVKDQDPRKTASADVKVAAKQERHPDLVQEKGKIFT